MFFMGIDFKKYGVLCVKRREKRWKKRPVVMKKVEQHGTKEPNP
jgi:hypothetical protein